MSARSNMPMKPKSSDRWDGMLPSFSVRSTTSAHMLVAVGRGNSLGSCPMSKTASLNVVVSGGMGLSMLKGEFAAATGLLSGGVAAAMIVVINTDFYSSTE